MSIFESTNLPTDLKTEKHTRKEIIDNRLKDAGWNVSDRTQVIEEFDIVVDKQRVCEAPTPYAGHQFSDYVLLGKDGKPLAVVEVKKSSRCCNWARTSQTILHKQTNQPWR